MGNNELPLVAAGDSTAVIGWGSEETRVAVAAEGGIAVAAEEGIKRAASAVWAQAAQNEAPFRPARQDDAGADARVFRAQQSQDGGWLGTRGGLTTSRASF